MRLSIIMPVYNGAATIGRALGSIHAKIAAANKPEVEVCVVDDGSCDNTKAVVEEFVRSHPSVRVVLMCQANAGSAAARNAALRTARGEWVLCLDADDELACDPVSYLDQPTERTAMAFSVVFRENGRPRGRLAGRSISVRNCRRILTARNPFTVSSVVWRRGMCREMFREKTRYLEDWEFWWNNMCLFSEMTAYPNVVAAIVHSHGGNKSGRYAELGLWRERLASTFLEEWGERLTRTEKNNLEIQISIGRLLQGEKVGMSALGYVPCDGPLYAKLMVYWALRGRFGAVDRYGGRWRRCATKKGDALFGEDGDGP